MIDFVIKMNGETIEGHPIDIENFKHSNNISERISIPLIQGMSYAPFHKNEKPSVGSRQKVEDNGYFKDSDNFVKHNYQIIDKTDEELLAMLEVLKSEQKNVIKSAYEKAAEADVTDGNSVVWNGGFDSAIKLDAAKRLAETAGATDVVFFDIENIGHTLSMVEATAVVMAVAGAFQTALAQKQNLHKAITDATTVAAVDAAVWA